jgi:hypothetical protein
MNLADQAGKPLDGAKPLHNPFRKGRRSASPCILVDHPLRFGWRPAPKVSFNLTMRLYSPQADALTGKWNPPPIEKVETVSPVVTH